jgi:hypothetical protein
MGVLKKEIEKLSKNGVPEFFKENSLNFYNLYKSPDNDVVTSIPMSRITQGGIYFLYYKDNSNWMQLSPILCLETKDKRIVFGVNLNFLPLDIRLTLFDDLVRNLDKNNNNANGQPPFNGINFEMIYKKLIRLGFEYSIVEYEIGRIVKVFEISYISLPTWLYSQHPVNKYDPIKLYDIWEKKLKNRPERHKEMITKIVTDFYDIKDELIEESSALKGHFKRLKANEKKFGNKYRNK